MSTRIFISCSFSDREFARELARSLDARGGKTWLSEHGVGRGGDWLPDLRHQLQEADAMVMIMPSSNSLFMNNTFFEAGAARAIGKDVVVVVRDIETVDRTNIPLDVAKAVVVDAGKQSMERVAATVMGAIAESGVPS